MPPLRREISSRSGFGFLCFAAKRRACGSACPTVTDSVCPLSGSQRFVTAPKGIAINKRPTLFVSTDDTSCLLETDVPHRGAQPAPLHLDTDRANRSQLDILTTSPKQKPITSLLVAQKAAAELSSSRERCARFLRSPRQWA
ncbi:unnamed protein product, partial [Iphiclides podalirius]